ncbi:MAG: Gfo/Idh/MocA family oxidoreductase [Planctomycetota bacterium]|jgi:predicted dehydrogenase
MNNRYDRRDFLKLGTTLGAGLALGSASPSSIANSPKESPKQINAAPIETVRIGFVGVGSRGSRHVQLLLKIEGLEIRAICDIVEERVKRAQRWVQEAGQPEPAGYSRGETDFRRMCEREDLDLVYTATPWRWHVPVCVAAMEAGKHAATEVPAAVTMDECWQLVETSEKTARHCVMMENCCYSRWMLMVLNMVRQGIFGELLHGECGYLHDCRALLLSPATIAQWATAHLIKRNGDLYPTHGLGPLAQCMNINRGDQFDYLVSMGGNSRGLNLFAAKKLGPDSPQVRQRYAQSDIVTTLIRTKNGGTIFLKFDMCSPRPYSRIDLLQGTKGIFRGYPEEKIYIEGKSPEHAWESTDKYKQEYEHPLWKALGESGGMDYIENYRLIKSLRTGTSAR